MFDLTFLGTAATTASAARGLPSALVKAGSDRFLIDCGEGTQRQMLRAGAGFRRLQHILLTHAHLDHVLGLGGLIATLGLLDIHNELTISGSAQTIEFVRGYLASLWGEGRAPVALRLASLEPGVVIEAREYRVSCFPVRHRNTQSLGYRFDTKPRRHMNKDRLAVLGVPSGPLRTKLAGGEEIALPDGRRIKPEDVLGPARPGASLVVVGDAEETGSLVEAVRGADALVIEATFLEQDRDLAARRGHLTASQGGWLATKAGVGALYLTHISGRYDPPDIAAEAATYFPEVKVVNDFDTIQVSAQTPPA